MKRLVLLSSLLLLLACGSKKEHADLIITGGTIYTVNDNDPVVEAVAVKGDTILFAGSAAEADEYRRDHTHVIDLDGKTMTPGFIEGHGHFIGMGRNQIELDLMSITSFEEMVWKVRDAVKQAKPGDWIVGRGWHQDKWTTKPDFMVKGFPVHDAISSVSPDNPVFLKHASGHASLANEKAMAIAGVQLLGRERNTSLIADGGEVILDKMGNPTGIFNETAQHLIAKHIPPYTYQQLEQAIEEATRVCHEHGITSFHDAGEDGDVLSVMMNLSRQQKLGVRLYVMIKGMNYELIQTWFDRGPFRDSLHFLTIRSVKLVSDGALGSRGAWLLAPYSDMPDQYGLPTMPVDTILNVSRRALKHGWQVCTHAIGDRANREVLNCYEKALQEAGRPADHRFRIEHAQHVDPADLPRFAALGVVPAMQAIHLSSDRPWAIDRLGEQRIKDGAYRWQTLLQSGARIVNGSDVPVEPINPIAGFYASVTRKTLAGEPAGGYEPGEKMTRQQALRSFTLDAAYGAFEEHIKGSIECGKLADFTVLSNDIMTIPEEDLLTTEVMMTIIGGKVVYQRTAGE